MGFSDILGQETAVATLTRALVSDRVHHAYRFEGPDGTGKEMAAFALAQALVCAGGDPLGCGRCDACRRAVTFAEERPRSPLHPDVRIIERGFYPPEVINKRTPEVTHISTEQVRQIILPTLGFPPHEGRSRLFIIRRVEELYPNAANALLKTLEEPPQGTYFVLLTSRPDRLLPTIRSRTLPLRFAPLSEAILRGILTKHGVPPERHDLAIELAGGSASAALSLADAEQTAQRDAFVSAALAAVKAQSLGPAVTLAETGDKDKDVLRQNLRALAATLAREARATAADASHTAPRAAARYECVQQAIATLDRNAQPSFVVSTMVAEMQRRSG